MFSKKYGFYLMVIHYLYISYMPLKYNLNVKYKSKILLYYYNNIIIHHLYHYYVITQSLI